LGVGVERDTDDRADVQTKLPSRLGVHDRFVRPIRIGEAALYESDAVLGRVLPVEAAENCWGCLADVQLVMDSLNPVRSMLPSKTTAVAECSTKRRCATALRTRGLYPAVRPRAGSSIALKNPTVDGLVLAR